MPVKKTKTQKSTATSTARVSESATHVCPPPSHEFARKILWTLVGILLAYLVIYFGTLIRNNIERYNYIGQAEKSERMVTVEAVGEAIAKPDIAMTTMGMSTQAPTVSEAQDQNSEIIDALIARLKGMGIQEADIETVNYFINPVYDYTEEEGRVLRGYEVSQNVRVKIREVQNANAVIALAGELGVNNVSGLTFTVDDKDVYLTQAREDAVSNLREKIIQVSRLLGVKPVSVISYDEYEENTGNYPLRAYDMGLGGAESAPSLESGSETIRLRVRVTLEIR